MIVWHSQTRSVKGPGPTRLLWQHVVGKWEAKMCVQSILLVGAGGGGGGGGGGSK